MLKLKLHLHGAPNNELILESGREYVFGRATDCDFPLEAQHGISRHHFKLIEVDGQWTVEVLSKFGEILHNGQPTQRLQLTVGSAFQLADYSFNLVDEAEAQEVAHSESLPMAVGQSENYSSAAEEPHENAAAAMAIVPSVQPTPEIDFEGNSEATRVISSQPELPFARVVHADGEETTIPLKGRKWTAGREDGCEILLNERKSSRRQFEITSSNQGYFIRDLGSSNGTLLNGKLLAADELKAIRSGDVIQVGRSSIHFEVRDPNFDKKLMVVSSHVRSDVPIVVENPYEIINYPMVPTGPGGAVKVGSSRAGLSAYWAGDDLKSEPEKKRRRIIVAGVGIVLFMALIFSLTGEQAPPPKPDAVNAPFARLTPKQQQSVKEFFATARGQYLQGNLATAADYLRKIHEIIPEGYENSIAMAQECKAAAEQKEQLEFIRAQQAKQEETRRLVDATIRKCDSMAKNSLDVERVKSCLADAIANDPENPRVNAMINQVQARAEERTARLAKQKEYNEQAAEGRKLFAEAKELEENGEWQDAIEAYQKHIDSSFPDPGKLKSESRRSRLALARQIGTKIDEMLRAADSAYAAGNFKDALESIKRAKLLDPENTKAAELNAKVIRDLRVKLKELYEEAIISEGIGDIEQAKVRWKKILETDHPDGEYYKKSRNKLRAYGAL